MTKTELLEKANSLPLCPGVYIMKDKQGKVIYVGKSRKLKNRVSQYFQNGQKNIKTSRMVQSVFFFDFYLCDTEMEALTLENTLIKQYHPKYNIRLKDAKSYPYLHLTEGDYPRLEVTRTRGDDKGKYFGPYSGVATAYSLKDLLCSTLKLPDCKKKFPDDFKKGRPCMNYQIGRCCGLCKGDITPEDYRFLTKQVGELLSGKDNTVKKQLEEQMLKASEEEKYEIAARYRDTLFAVDKINQKQKVVASPDMNADVIGTYTDDFCTCISILSVRYGRLIDKEDYLFGSDQLLEEEDIASFLPKHYRNRGEIPPEILCSFPTDEENGVAEYLSQIAGRKIQLHQPMRGEKVELCKLATANAKEQAQQYERDADKTQTVLSRLAELLCLETYPTRIESYDISNLGKEQLTAGMVVMTEGKFTKSDYRSFKIKSVEGTDDYASMREALTRRLAHLSDEQGSFAQAPDLILLDGGKGHVGVIRELMKELNLDIPVFGMVKDDYHKTRALCSDTGEVSVAREQAVYQLLYKLQEEVHRFTISRMKTAKEKTLKTSTLTAIPGIGEGKAKKLLIHFAGIAKIKKATVEELMQVKGMGKKDCQAIYDYFHAKDKT